MPTTEDQRRDIRLICGQAVDQPDEIPDSVINLMFDGPGIGAVWSTAYHVLLWCATNAARLTNISADGQSLSLSDLQAKFERAAATVARQAVGAGGTLSLGRVGQLSTRDEWSA